MSQPHLELRLVVLGAHDSGKTFVINTLLGQVASETETESRRGTDNCLKKEGEVNGRKVIFIDTPGWWRNYPLSDTADFIKQELVLSVTKCPPGPHAFLLAIDSDAPFSDKNRRSLEEHVGRFGDHVWGHTVLVFTRGESLEGKSIEQHIESEGEALKWVAEKCGNRCHMLCNSSTEGGNMATELLDQIDDLVAKSRNSHFELEDRKLREVAEKRKRQEEKAKVRQQKVMDQRQRLHKCGVIPSLPELRILLLGWLISGKTFASSTILGHHVKREKRSRTRQSVRMSEEVSGRQVSVVDTPGWWKYLPAIYTPEWVKTELENGLTLDSKAPHAVLLAVPADTTFLEEQRKITEDNMKMFGGQVWRHTIVLFTCGDRLGDISIEEHIASEGEALEWLIEKCGNRYHVMSWDDNEDKVKELLEKIEEMMADISLLRPESKAQTTVEKETTEESEDQRKLACFLDQEWESMDKAVEETIISMLSIITPKKTQSMKEDLNFSKNDPPFEGTSEDINSGKGTNPLSRPEPQSSMKESTDINATPDKPDNPDQKQTSDRHADLREMLEMEWNRRELGTTQRFQRLLAQLREAGTSSEADLHDMERSWRKVMGWKHEPTSGYSSHFDEDIGHVSGEDELNVKM